MFGRTACIGSLVVAAAAAATITGCMRSQHFYDTNADKGDSLIGGDGQTVGDDVPCPTPAPVSVEAVYGSHANWNRYVVRSDPALPPYAQPEATCVGDELSGPSSCVHGGEMRRVAVPTEVSCNGLAVRDSGDRFNWICDDSSGSAIFYSTGLADGVGLRDLITMTGQMTPLRVDVRRATCVVASTPATVWWQNALVELPHNDGTGREVLTAADTIYYSADAQRMTDGYVIDADGVAVVTLADGWLVRANYVPICNDAGEPFGTTPGVLLCSGGEAFLWIEVRLDGSGDGTGLYLSYGQNSTTRQSRVHNTDIRNTGSGIGTGFANDRMVNSLVTHLRVWNAAGYGVWPWWASRNVYVDVTIAHTEQEGLILSADCADNWFHRLTIANTGATTEAGILAQRATDTIFTDLVVAGSAGDGVVLGTAATHRRGTIIGASIVNNGGVGITSMDGVGNTLANVVLVNNGGGGLAVISSDSDTLWDISADANGPPAISVSANDTIVGGAMRIDGGATCEISGTNNQIQNVTCNFGSTLALPPVTGLAIAAGFRGKVMVDDAVSQSDQQGSQRHSLIADWTELESSHRVWGKLDAAAFPNALHRGPCDAAESCRIWDWRPLLGAGDVGDAFGVFPMTSSSPCPPSLDSANAANVIGGAGGSVLAHAIEIPMDWIGDEDGLCESNERCYYMPNLGAYYGEIASSSMTCAFDNGANITGVEVVALVP